MRFTHTVLLNSLFEEKNKKAREEKDNRKGSKEVESDLVNVLECSSKSERFTPFSCMHVWYGTVRNGTVRYVTLR